MYDTTVVCTYMDDDVILESDGVNDNEASFIRSCIYRQELLNIFCLEEFDESAINKQIFVLYEKVKNMDGFKDLLTNEFSPDDGLLGFTILYSYDFLHLTHPLICELLETGTIKTTEKLKASILNN
jgi:hypothetical protein